MPITAWMDGLAPASPGPATGPQFDNRRVFAALIDIALLVPVALLMATLFDGFTAPAATLTMGWGLYYYFAFESDHGQTIGKRAMKIRVVRADGKPLDSGRAAVRTLLRPIDGIGAYLVGLVVMLATGQRRQRLGDLAAGTVVTDAGASGAPEAPVIEPPAIDAPPPVPEERVVDTGPAPGDAPEMRPFEPFAEPEPEPVSEPEPEPAPEDIVPVERPEEAAPPTDQPVPVPEAEAQPEPEPEPMEIVTSPIDLVMQDQDEQDGEPEDPDEQPPLQA